jgi:hypothetical protein
LILFEKEYVCLSITFVQHINETKQNKTKQNKTKQNKTEQKEMT